VEFAADEDPSEFRNRVAIIHWQRSVLGREGPLMDGENLDAQTLPDAVRCADERAGDLARCAAVSDDAKPAAMAAAIPIPADRRPGRCSRDTATSPTAQGTSTANDG
jgi:hypothetical protein